MQRSITTSTPRSGFFSVGRTSSRSSIVFVVMPRDASSCRSSFSSTRTRERSTPTVGLFAPVFFGLGRQRERDRRRRGHLELRAAVRARDDLAFDRVGADRHLGIAFGTLGHDWFPPPRPLGYGKGYLLVGLRRTVLRGATARFVEVHALVGDREERVGGAT